MIELTRGLSYVLYSYADGPLQFSVPFPYIDKGHVYVFVGPTDSPRAVSTSWIDESTIKIPSQEGKLTTPFTVTIRRITPVDVPLVNFRGGAALPHQDLNKAVRQLLYAQQESRDYALTGGTLPGGDGGAGAFPDINEIVEEVIRSEALQKLLEQIQLIDMNAETLLEVILRDHDIFNTVRDYGSQISTANTRIDLMQSGNDVTAQQITELFARTSANSRDIAARFLELNEAVVNEILARTSAMTEMQSQFDTQLGDTTSALNQRIDQTFADASSAWAAADAALGATLTETIDGVITTNIAQVRDSLNLRVDGQESRLTSVETGVARHDGNYAALQDKYEAVATEASANTLLRQALAARFGVAEEGNEIAASLDNQLSSLAQEDLAIAETLQTLQATKTATYFSAESPTVPAGGFSIGDFWVKLMPNNKNELYFWNGTGWAAADIAETSPTGTLVRNLQTVKIDANQASAIAQSQLQSFTNGQFAALQQSFNTYVSNNDEKWDATWTIKINGGKIGEQPVVAGVALSAGAEVGSDFVVMADRFAFVTPTYLEEGGLGQLKYPFVIGEVGGVSTVGINGALVVDGSIFADKIRANSLSSITANLGTVNGGTFKTLTLDEEGEVVDPLEFRAEISNQGEWPLWVGSGVKNANNAVFWVDRNGNASFDGRVAAPNITGGLQVLVPVSWGGYVTPGNMTEVCRFTVPGPTRVGESHAVIISLAVNVQSVESSNGVYGLYIQRLAGSVWETVVGAQLNHGSGHGINQALACVSPQLSATTTFRVVAKDIENGHRFRVQSVIGFAMGAR